MLGLPRFTHAPLHSREQTCLGGDSEFSFIPLCPWTKVSCLFYLQSRLRGRVVAHVFSFSARVSRAGLWREPCHHPTPSCPWARCSTSRTTSAQRTDGGKEPREVFVALTTDGVQTLLRVTGSTCPGLGHCT